MAQQQQPTVQAAPMMQVQPAPMQTPALQTPKLVRRSSAQKKGGVKPPSAPTSAKPPYSFHAASPHGTPVYANNEFHPDKLSIPANKKRKANAPESANTTPIQPVTSLPPQQRPVFPPAKANMAMPSVDDQASAKVEWPFKCELYDCEYTVIGFEDKADCDRHTEKVHEYNGDPLAYMLKNLKRALGLDENGKTIVREKDVKAGPPSAQPANHNNVKYESAGKLAVPSMKREGTSPGETPMSRGPTQTSAQGGDSRIPQNNVKAGSNDQPASPGMKRSASAAELSSKNQKPAAVTITGNARMDELWANSLVTPQALRQVFGQFDHLGNPRMLPDNLDVSSVTDDDSDSSTDIDTPETGDNSRPHGTPEGSGELRRQIDDWEPFIPELVQFGEVLADPLAAADDDGAEEVQDAFTDEAAYLREWEKTFGQTGGGNSTTRTDPMTGRPLLIVDDEGYVLNYEEVLGPFQ